MGSLAALLFGSHQNGMKTFAGLAAVLTGAGFAIGFIAPDEVVMGGWVGGVVLFAFAFGLLAAFKKGLAA